MWYVWPMLVHTNLVVGREWHTLQCVLYAKKAKGYLHSCLVMRQQKAPVSSKDVDQKHEMTCRAVLAAAAPSVGEGGAWEASG